MNTGDLMRIDEFETKLLRRMKLIRKKRKISQAEVAAVLSVDQSVYSRMERGEISYPLRSLLIVCKFIQFPFLLFDGVEL